MLHRGVTMAPLRSSLPWLVLLCADCVGTPAPSIREDRPRGRPPDAVPAIRVRDVGEGSLSEGVSEGGVEVRVPEGEPGLEQSLGRDTLPREQQVLGHFTEREAQREPRDGKHGGAS